MMLPRFPVGVSLAATALATLLLLTACDRDGMTGPPPTDTVPGANASSLAR